MEQTTVADPNLSMITTGPFTSKVLHTATLLELGVQSCREEERLSQHKLTGTRNNHTMRGTTASHHSNKIKQHIKNASYNSVTIV